MYAYCSIEIHYLLDYFHFEHFLIRPKRSFASHLHDIIFPTFAFFAFKRLLKVKKWQSDKKGKKLKRRKADEV